MGTLKDITGQKFGRITVLSRAGSDKSKKATWNCRCECGKEKVIRGSDLIAGKIKSCGCIKTEMLMNDISNKKFGKLTAIKPLGRIGRGVSWLCQCECGGKIEVSENHLITGNTQSCGCLVSKGENEIYSFLRTNHLDFIKQCTFPDLLGKNKCPLRFDFGLLDKNNQIKKIIEYQGIQHYINIYNLSDEDWEYSLQRDEMKREYCKKNNITLIEIKYTDNILEKLQELLCS